MLIPDLLHRINIHENAYLSEFHHCFSIPSKSSEKSKAGLMKIAQTTFEFQNSVPG
ncbi:hypothetical protein ACS0TY_022599 [Phlomoides rotata]